jgi:hypothetical protein
MIRAFGIVSAALIVLTAPAQAAATLNVQIGSVNPVPSNNDFQSNLQGIGLFNFTDVGSAVSLSSASKLRFEFVAREASFNNSFQTSSLSFTSMGPTVIGWDAGVLIGTQNYGAGAITDWQFVRPDSTTYSIGTQQFGIFLPRGVTPNSGTFSTRVLYLGFDDTGAGPDDNHDDLILRVSVVPEPATWAMLIVGFGLIGATMRQRTGTAQTSS